MTWLKSDINFTIATIVRKLTLLPAVLRDTRLTHDWQEDWVKEKLVHSLTFGLLTYNQKPTDQIQLHI